MKVQVVCYEDPDQWICGKIARRLAESLRDLGHDASLVREPGPSADVNHHVIYLTYAGYAVGINTLMVTHIDNAVKLGRLRQGLQTAQAAICMSREAVETLHSLGVDRKKLDFAHLAHDGEQPERKFAIGLTTRLYPDGRKKEADLVRLIDHLSPDDFCFRIMGFGWQPIVEGMRKRGFTVDYQPDFAPIEYRALLAGLDYYLYLANDEGSAGFIDALAAGVKTIVTPQGFHLDAPGGITHPITGFESLKKVFDGIAADKRTRMAAVASWTWENYARKHLEVWTACLSGKELPAGGQPGPSTATAKGALGLKTRLWINYFVQRARMMANLGKDFDCQSRIWEKKRSRQGPKAAASRPSDHRDTAKGDRSNPQAEDPNSLK